MKTTVYYLCFALMASLCFKGEAMYAFWRNLIRTNNNGLIVEPLDCSRFEHYVETSRFLRDYNQHHEDTASFLEKQHIYSQQLSMINSPWFTPENLEQKCATARIHGKSIAISTLAMSMAFYHADDDSDDKWMKSTHNANVLETVHELIQRGFNYEQLMDRENYCIWVEIWPSVETAIPYLRNPDARQFFVDRVRSWSKRL